MASKPEAAISEAAIPVLPYQKRSLLDRSRFKCLFWARGARKSFTATLEIVDSIFAAEANGKREEWNIISRGERQSLIEMAEIKKHLRAYNLAIQETLGADVWSELDGRHIKVLEIVTANGSIIRALPANPDTIRGYTCNIYLAEFGVFPPDISQQIWEAAYPCLRGRLRMIVASTGKGKGNKFYQIATDTTGVWSIHTVDIYQAVDDGLPFDIDVERKALNDPDAWAQEYELHWLDEASAWLSYDMISAVEHEDAGNLADYSGNLVFMGLDIARRHDLWVLWVVERLGDVLWTRQVEARRRISFAEQDALVAEAFNRYKVGRLCVDQTGMGERIVEDYQSKYGDLIVEGVMFTQASKLVMATTARRYFEDRQIRIPIDNNIRIDLHSLKKESSVSGAPRFIADGTGDGHADRAWACFLAIYAADTPAFIVDGRTTGGDRDLPTNGFTHNFEFDLGGFYG